jgi:hypothetical protein
MMLQIYFRILHCAIASLLILGRGRVGGSIASHDCEQKMSSNFVERRSVQSTITLQEKQFKSVIVNDSIENYRKWKQSFDGIQVKRTLPQHVKNNTDQRTAASVFRFEQGKNISLIPCNNSRDHSFNENGLKRIIIAEDFLFVKNKFGDEHLGSEIKHSEVNFLSFLLQVQRRLLYPKRLLLKKRDVAHNSRNVRHLKSTESFMLLNGNQVETKSYEIDHDSIERRLQQELSSEVRRDDEVSSMPSDQPSGFDIPITKMTGVPSPAPIATTESPIPVSPYGRRKRANSC